MIAVDELDGMSDEQIVAALEEGQRYLALVPAIRSQVDQLTGYLAGRRSVSRDRAQTPERAEPTEPTVVTEE